MDPDAPQTDTSTDDSAVDSTSPVESDQDAALQTPPSDAPQTPPPDAPQPDAPQIPPEPLDDDGSAFPTGEPAGTASTPPDASVPVTTPPDQDASTPPSIIAPAPSPAADLQQNPPPVQAPTPANALPVFDPHSADEINFVKTVLAQRSVIARRARVNDRLNKIVELARAKGTVDRTAVRLFLRVSQTTASTYLTTLVREGRLVRQHVQSDFVYRVAE